MVEDAGHGLHFEQPMLVRKLIHEFLLRTDLSQKNDYDDDDELFLRKAKR